MVTFIFVCSLYPYPPGMGIGSVQHSEGMCQGFDAFRNTLALCLLIALRLKMCKVQDGRNYETLNLCHDTALSGPVCICRTGCMRLKFSGRCPTQHTSSKRYAKQCHGIERTDRLAE